MTDVLCRYLVAIDWLRNWKVYVGETSATYTVLSYFSSSKASQSPGPINNASILGLPAAHMHSSVSACREA